MKIGIVGDGVIGSANRKGFTHFGHAVTTHDKKYDTSICDVLVSDIIFICVPTPSTHEGYCDTSVVESVVKELIDHKFLGIIAIRSTVIPGTTDSFIEKYQNEKICFVPEFLRERSAVEDFIDNQNLVVIGSNNHIVIDMLTKLHHGISSNIIAAEPAEAELVKYFNNTYAAMKVVYANIMYELSKSFDVSYEKILNSYLLTGKSTGNYLTVNSEMRGFGGMCLPKDTRALARLISDLNLDFSLIDAVLEDNSKLDKTVFKGMRP